MVERRAMNQWYIKITAYAEELYTGLDKINWPDNVKNMQRGWIGRHKGNQLTFETTAGVTLTTFTGSADKLLSVTFVVVSPELALEKLLR
jgi:leucyl-tRNA synthetase